MISLLRRLWQAAPLATLLLALSLAVGLFFAARMTMFWVYWHDPAHHQQQIEDWMTPSYVAHSWGVPREVVTTALGLPEKPQHSGPVTLRRIAQDRGMPVAELIASLEAAIARFQAEMPRSGGRP